MRKQQPAAPCGVHMGAAGNQRTCVIKYLRGGQLDENYLGGKIQLMYGEIHLLHCAGRAVLIQKDAGAPDDGVGGVVCPF